MYYVTEIDTRDWRDDEFLIGKTEDMDKAIEMARHNWASMCEADRKHNDIEIRVYVEDIEDEDCTCFDYDTIAWTIAWREEE